MDEIPSTTFRRRYAALDQPTVVTVNGHPIGIWVPQSGSFAVVPDGHAIDFPVENGLAVLPDGRRIESSAQVVRVPLANPERFNTQPFTGPIPKGTSRK